MNKIMLESFCENNVEFAFKIEDKSGKLSDLYLGKVVELNDKHVVIEHDENGIGASKEYLIAQVVIH